MNRFCACEGACPRCSHELLHPSHPQAEQQADDLGAELAGHLPSAGLCYHGALSASTCNQAGHYLGTSLEGTRLRADKHTQTQLSHNNAQAYAQDREVAVNAESPSPASMAGKQLVGHELVHLAQQQTHHAPTRQFRPYECGQRNTPEQIYADDNKGEVFKPIAVPPGKPPKTGPNLQDVNNEFLLWNFCPGSAQLRTSHQAAVLDAAQRWQRLRQGDPATKQSPRPGLRVKLFGAASSSGTVQANEALALERCEQVKQALVAGGFPVDRIDSVGLGSRSPLAPETSPENMARNRRVEVVLYQPVTTTPSIGWVGAFVSGEKAGKFEDVDPKIKTKSAFLPHWDEKNNSVSVWARGAMMATAQISLTSPVAPIHAGFIQIMTNYHDRGTMRLDNDPRGQVKTLDYGHCVGRILPCHDSFGPDDVFLDYGPRSGYHSVKLEQPGSTLGTALMVDSPGGGVPLRWPDPQNGPYFARQLYWNMDFVLLIAVFDPGLQALEVLEHMYWNVHVNADVEIILWPNKKIRNVKVNVAPYPPVHSAFFKGAPPGVDIESAMSGPTCRMATRQISDKPGDKPCQPFES